MWIGARDCRTRETGRHKGLRCIVGLELEILVTALIGQAGRHCVGRLPAIEQIACRLPLSIRHHVTTILSVNSEHSRRAIGKSSLSPEPFLSRPSRISVILTYSLATLTTSFQMAPDKSLSHQYRTRWNQDGRQCLSSCAAPPLSRCLHSTGSTASSRT